MGLFNHKKENLEVKGVTVNADDPLLNYDLKQRSASGVPIQIMANDGVNICAEACAACWDTKLPGKYADRVEYISKRTRIGHGSVTEHSNHCYYIEVSDDDLVDLSEFLSNVQYCHTVYKHSKEYSLGYLIIAGSWRAYRDIILKMKKMYDNKIMIKLLAIMNETMSPAGFADFIKNGTLPEDFCKSNAQYGSCNEGLIYSKGSYIDINENIEVINIDDFNVLLDNINGICPEPELFTMYDLLDMCTITVLFKNMSRVITQQLVRHRNAITQESQRYVDYSGGEFNSPAKFKDKYDPEYKYSIQFGKSSQKMTLQEIGDAMTAIYGQLSDKERTDGHELMREDARAYLPNNVKCRKIYMTFTWRTFFSFLYLREDTHAQVEIREYAQALGDWFRDLYHGYKNVQTALLGYTCTNSDFWISPIKYNYPDTNEVDEVISEEEIISEMEKYASDHPSSEEEV